MSHSEDARQRTRIAWIYAPLFPRGGGYDILRGWVRHFDRQRFEVVLVYSFPDLREVEVVQRELGQEPGVTLIHLSEFDRPSSFLSGVWKLARILRRERVSLVQTVTIRSDILGGLAARIAGTRILLSSVIGLLYARRSGTLGYWFYRIGHSLVRGRFDRVIAISEATRGELVREFGLDPEKVTVIRSGIELSQAGPRLPRSGPTVGIASWMVPEKGIQYFLEAVPSILALHPSARFFVIGDGPFRAELEAIAGRSSIQGRVEFTGWVENARPWIERLDVFVFASLEGYDGLPRVVLEAWAAGTPLVATRVSGVPEIVRDGQDAVLVEPGSSQAIADAVLGLLGDPARAAALAERGRVRAAEFGNVGEVRQMEELYRQLLEAPAST